MTVAAVLAQTEAQAQDAPAIDVEYEALDAVIDLEDALADRVVIHDGIGTNKSYTWELKIGEDAVAAAFASGAAFTVKERYVQQRLILMAMETRPSSPCHSRSAATSRSTRPRRSRTS